MPSLKILLFCPEGNGTTRSVWGYGQKLTARQFWWEAIAFCAKQELVSTSARLAYPIRDGIPVMLEDEAREISEDEYKKYKAL